MRQWVSAFLLVGTLAAQQANYIILLETSQYTCGKPTQTAKQVLSDLLCSGSYGRVAIGTFYRKGERGYIDWKTTPVLEGGGTPCISTLKTIKPRCDSIYMVHLLGALETALEGGYVRAPEIILLASGMDATQGLKDTDILRLAQSKNVRIHALSIGYLANDDRAQALLKRLSGQYGEGPSRGLYQIADPQSPTYQNIISNFLSSCLSQAVSGPTLEGGPPGSSANYPSTPVGEVPRASLEGTSESSKPNYTLWILIGAGALVLVGLIISLTARKPAPPPPAPAAPPPPSPVMQAPPAPTLRRLIIHYPHGTQEVQLSPSPAPINLGRAPDNTIVISDPTVSSRHARLYLQGNQWYIQDLGSTNGTFVNNLRVTQHPVRIGDQIRLGAIVIQVG
jgi:hypothetical protein